MDVSEEEEEMRRMQELELEKSEPLLQENPRRFVLFPIQHSDIWHFYKKAVGTVRKGYGAHARVVWLAI